MSFKQKHAFEKRKDEAHRILQKYPERIPVICEKDPRSRDIPDIDRKKYLVPADLSIANFMYVIRKRIKLSSEQALFIFINETMPPISENMSLVYNKHEDEDGFLYITYSGENTFG